MLEKYRSHKEKNKFFFLAFFLTFLTTVYSIYKYYYYIPYIEGFWPLYKAGVRVLEKC